jgi:predicted peroxiredoxin
MKLGILINTDKHLAEITGLTRAASDKGHEVTIFAMDDGTRLLEEADYVALAGLANVKISYCDHSAIELAVKKEGLPEEIERSSQYNNAAMIHNADKVIVL